MKVVIDIPEEEYEICLSHRESIENMIRVHKCFSLEYAVINGTPLPKGHGRLIDADATIKEFGEWTDEWDDFAIGCLKSADTIIEADKEENK